MKKIYYLLAGIFAIILSGCSDYIGISEPEVNSEKTENRRSGAISETEALAMAFKASGNRPTRSAANARCEYVLNSDLSIKGQSVPDTVAYVINYENEGGFVIVSGDRRVYPILAYSDEGHFSFDNEIAVEQFINKIAPFIDTQDSNEQYGVEDINKFGEYDINDFGVSLDPNPPFTFQTITIEPPTKTWVGQRDGWNKYVNLYLHATAPAGCVPVATALTMLHSKRVFTYQGETFYSRPILAGITDPSRPDNPYIPQSNTATTNDSGEPILLPFAAKDKVAKLIYLIAKDLGTKYEEHSGLTSPIKAYDMLVREGFPITAEYQSFDKELIISLLRSKSYIQVSGSIEGSATGHSWMIDGCRYNYWSRSNPPIYGIYLHHDWGWSGEDNGYYRSDVIELHCGKFTPNRIFAVQREWNFSDD